MKPHIFMAGQRWWVARSGIADALRTSDGHLYDVEATCCNDFESTCIQARSPEHGAYWTLPFQRDA